MNTVILKLRWEIQLRAHSTLMSTCSKFSRSSSGIIFCLGILSAGSAWSQVPKATSSETKVTTPATSLAKPKTPTQPALTVATENKKVPESAARDPADEESFANNCLDENQGNTDEAWALLEKTIPACKRAIVSFEHGAKLDLGPAPVVKLFSNGMTSIKVRAVSARGIYTNDNKTQSLDGVELWVSLDRCQMRNVVWTNVQENEVAFKKARFGETTEELNAIANGDELKNYKNDCAKKLARRFYP